MGTPPVEENEMQTIHRAQLRLLVFDEIKAQQTNATGQSNWYANHRDFSKSR